MNKRSEPLFQKSNFLPPGSDKFLNFFITLRAAERRGGMGATCLGPQTSRGPQLEKYPKIDQGPIKIGASTRH